MGIFYMMTFRKGTKVTVNYGENKHVLNFEDKCSAKTFIDELHSAQYDLNVRGRNKAKRKKSFSASPSDNTVTMDFHLDRKKEKPAIIARFESAEEAKNFYQDLAEAVFGTEPIDTDEP